MASNVAQPLERQFAQIPGVAQTTSTSGLGVTTVVVQFDLDRNIDAAANDIQAAINAAERASCRKISLSRRSTARSTRPTAPIHAACRLTSDAMTLTDVDDNADTKLAQQISQISGVGQVTIGGEQKPAMRIQIDPAKLYAKGSDARGRAHAAVDHDGQQPQGQRRQRQAQATRSTPTTS